MLSFVIIVLHVAKITLVVNSSTERMVSKGCTYKSTVWNLDVGNGNANDRCTTLPNALCVLIDFGYKVMGWQPGLYRMMDL
jgi:hypothetical protein